MGARAGVAALALAFAFAGAAGLDLRAAAAGAGRASTLSGASASTSYSSSGRACASFSLMSSQVGLLSLARGFMRTSVQWPLSFSPRSSNLSLPSLSPRRASPSGHQVPRSHTMTVPAP